MWDINKSTEANSLVKAMITIGKELNMRIIAEGVETNEQIIFLAQAGCDLIQGYYIGKAMSEADLMALIFENKPMPSNINHCNVLGNQ